MCWLAEDLQGRFSSAVRASAKTYRNISFATVGSFSDLLAEGTVLTTRGQEVRELRNRVTVLRRPQERCVFAPQRGHSVFVSVAETMWVLAGRDDIGWLKTYLPRAGEFSDDGVIWRGAYGPRLRNWQGVDQLNAVRELLLAEATTRRAVMSLYDPTRDFAPGKDIPCNNWLHWLIRDGSLHLNVAVRSNDAVWGFSGINSFEWSVLQEMMAYWTGTQIGEATYLASSFHLYARHYAMARAAADAFRGISCYDFGLTAPAFTVPWVNFDALLRDWFALEDEVRARPDQPINAAARLGDPFLATTLELCRLYRGAQLGWTGGQLKDQLAALPASDLAVAAYEYFGRKHPEVLADIPQPVVADFMAAYLAVDPEVVRPVSVKPLLAAIKALHAEKNRIYGPAWKKRGELTSVLANLARKVDRIEHYHATGGKMADESIFDTAVDLFVYLTKYRLFLLEQLPGGVPLLDAAAPRQFSDHVTNFECLVDQTVVPEGPRQAPAALADELIREFEAMHQAASGDTASAAVRLDRATQFGALVFRYLFRLAEQHPSFLPDLTG